MLDVAVSCWIGFQSDGVEVPLCFEAAIHMGISKTRVSTEEPQDVTASISSNDGLQNALPILGTMDIAIAKEGSLNIAVVIEAEKRMITGTLEAAIVGRAFLIAVSRADGTVHIQRASTGLYSMSLK